MFFSVIGYPANVSNSTRTSDFLACKYSNVSKIVFIFLKDLIVFVFV